MRLLGKCYRDIFSKIDLCAVPLRRSAGSEVWCLYNTWSRRGGCYTEFCWGLCFMAGWCALMHLFLSELARTFGRRNLLPLNHTGQGVRYCWCMLILYILSCPFFFGELCIVSYDAQASAYWLFVILLQLCSYVDCSYLLFSCFYQPSKYTSTVFRLVKKVASVHIN